MRNLRKITAITVVVAMVLSLMSFGSVFAAEYDNSVVVSATPSAEFVEQGGTVDVTVDLTTAKAFKSGIIGFNLVFDTDVFEYQNVEFTYYDDDLGNKASDWEANSGFNTSTNKFVFGTLGTTVYTADNAKRQSLAKVTLKVKDTAKDGVQNISIETFNGADSNLDLVSSTLNSAKVEIGKAPAQTVKIDVTPSAENVAQGGTVDMTVDMTSAKAFKSGIIGFDLVFDTNVFEYQGVKFAYYEDDLGNQTSDWEANSGFNASTNHFVFGTLGTTVYTADHAKHQPIAVVTLKVKDNAPDGAQAINLTTFNGVDANLDKVGATMNSTSVTIGGAVVPTATAVPVPTATAAPVENYIATLNVTNGTGTLTNASGEVYPTVAPATEAPVPTDAPIVTDAPVVTDKPVVTDAPVPGKSVEWTFADAPAGTKLVNKAGVEKEWYVGNVDLGNSLMSYSNGTIDENKIEYKDAFEVDRKTDTEFTLENGTTETVTGALKFGGKTTAAARYLTYTPSADGAITVYVKHGSPDKLNTDIRNLIVEQGSEKTIVETIGTDKKFVVQTVPVVANSEVKISCDGNVALAKLVYTPAAKAASVAADTAGAQYIIPAGDTVTINAVSNIAGATAVVTVKAADGTDIAVSDSKFVMPEQNASVDVVFGGSVPTPSADPATITTIAGSITAPASNRAVSYDIAAPEGARYKLSDVSWNPAVESRYEYNTVYTITFTATADENCTISADAVATVNSYDADSITVSADGKTAVVTYEFAKTSKKGSSSGPSGPDTGNTGKATATPAPTKAPTPTTEPGKQVFEDVPSTYWAYSYIMDLYDAGIVNGASATMFYPENNVTRAEFTKMAVVLFGLDSKSTESQFTDVPANEWYAKYVVAATEAGIVTGISETEFAPNDDVTREQMAAIIGRYLDITSKAAMKYTDSAAISDYAVPYVSGLTEKGLLTGEEDGTFRPAASAARSEAAALLSRVKATMSAPEETAAPEKTAAPEATASAEPEATASAEPVATATAAPEATATPSK
ncbi:S-layer homology domain-containing protein [Monoglobus pectinilyticus]|uniref:S-layer homology domain-containing protein n=1 Tax=Monoglobus pectinilyticus TaxID=1981510 RepID=UPI002E7694FE|nr:S-layer homology domain-containing protein [Monoglobus pectinilyticus]MEE0734064.1 S-layer homology domain-containing protein [Monoglobus pectinilyticus]